MSLLAKSNQTDSQIATKATRVNAKKTLKTQSIKTDEHLTRAETNLDDVAIAIADAETNQAMQTYSARTAENLGKFAQHVKNTQHQVSSAWIEKIYSDFGVKEGDLYEPNQE